MAGNKRISELEFLLDIADDDLLLVVDTSEEDISIKTKKITFNDLQEKIEQEIVQEVTEQLVDDFGLKAPLESPAFTGNPTAPTQIGSDSTTKLATTAFVQGAVAPKANIASPSFTGTPTAPTPTALDDSTKLATTSFVKTAVQNSSTPDASDLVKGKIQLAGDLGGTASAPTVPALASKAPLASPAFTGNPTAPTQTQGDNSTKVATTAYVDSAVAPKAPLASPSFTGTPTAPTPTTGDNTTKVATTAFVKATIDAMPAPTFTVPDATTSTKGAVKLAGDLGGTADLPTVPALASKAPLASPAFTGTPTAPTQATGDNSTKVATTAYVKQEIDASALTIKPSSDITALDINWALANFYKKSISTNTAFTFSNASDGMAISVAVTNTSGADVTVTFPITNLFKVAGTLTVTANSKSIFSFIHYGTFIVLADVKTLVPA